MKADVRTSGTRSWINLAQKCTVTLIQTWESAQLCEHCSPTELRRSSQPILTIELIREADPAC